MRNEAESGRHEISINRRGAERFAIGPLPLRATWLSERQKIHSAGELLDISSGGFGGRMTEAPGVGHLLHTRLLMPMVAGETSQSSIEADARVCGRTPVSNDPMPAWIVHFAIETIHPIDEKRMAEAIQNLKRRMA